jgi:hypothetical protein
MSSRIFIRVATAVASAAIAIGPFAAPVPTAVICGGGGNCARSV